MDFGPPSRWPGRPRPSESGHNIRQGAIKTEVRRKVDGAKISSPQNSLFRFIIRSTFHKAKIEKPLNSFLEHGQVQAVHNVLAAALIRTSPAFFKMFRWWLTDGF